MSKKEFLYISGIVVVSTVVSILLWGFHIGINNNEFTSIIVDKIADGTSFQGDALASTMGNFVSALWLVVGELVKIFPRNIVYFVFFFISRALLCIGLASIINSFAKPGHLLHAYVLSSLVTISSGSITFLPLGGEPVISNFLSQTYLSIGFCAISCALSFQKKFVWSAIVLGIAYNINAMQANFVLGIALVIWFLHAREEKNAYRSFGLPVALFLLCASPTLFWVITTLDARPAGDFMSGAAVADFAKYYLADHYFWSLKTLSDKLDGISNITIPLTLIASGFILKGSAFDYDRKRDILTASLVSLLYMLVGAVSVERFPSRFFLELHLFRSDLIIYLISLSLLLSLVLNKNLQKYTKILIGIAIAESLDAAFFKAQAFVLWALIIEGARYYQVKEVFIKIADVFLFSFIFCILLIRKDYWDLLLLAAAVLYGLYSLESRQSPARPQEGADRHRQPAAEYSSTFSRLVRGNFTAIAFLPVFLFVAHITYSHYIKYFVHVETDQTEIRALARTVSDKVPRNSLFLIPPWYEVRPFLKHGVFVTIKDGAAYLWDKGYETEYIRRLKVLGIPYTPGVPYDVNEITKYFFSHMDDTLRDVRREGVTHVILPKEIFAHALNFGAGSLSVGESEKFIVMDIDSAIKRSNKKMNLSRATAPDFHQITSL